MSTKHLDAGTGRFRLYTDFLMWAKGEARRHGGRYPYKDAFAGSWGNRFGGRRHKKEKVVTA